MHNVVKVLLVVFAVCAMASVAHAGPFTTSFDSGEGYSTGALDTQQGWAAFGGAGGNVVSTAQVHSGDQSLDLVFGAKRELHSIDSMSGNDVDVVFWFYRADSDSGFLVPILGQVSDGNTGDVLFVRPDDPTGQNYAIRDLGAVIDTGVASPVATWTRVRARYLWDGSKYDKYELFIGPEGSETTLVDALDNRSANWELVTGPATLDEFRHVGLSFVGAGHTFIDDLSISLVPELVPVPEPATLGLGLLGAAIMVMPLRRRRVRAN